MMIMFVAPLVYNVTTDRLYYSRGKGLLYIVLSEHPQIKELFESIRLPERDSALICRYIQKYGKTK